LRFHRPPASFSGGDNLDLDENVGLNEGCSTASQPRPPTFEGQGSSHFINLGSVVGLKVFSSGGTVYSGTKFAVRAISEGLRQEVGGSIRVTTIEPGAVESELKFGSGHEASRAWLIDFYSRRSPAQSVARAVAFAIKQPPDVDINEIVLRPTVEEF
jgi:NADP-dependent 3-hydroxy acid dehydrogenase YdfG